MLFVDAFFLFPIQNNNNKLFLTAFVPSTRAGEEFHMLIYKINSWIPLSNKGIEFASRRENKNICFLENEIKVYAAPYAALQHLETITFFNQT